MLTFLTERHICVYKRDIDNALGKYRKYMVGEPELMNGAINEFVNARFFIQTFLDLGEIMAVVYYRPIERFSPWTPWDVTVWNKNMKIVAGISCLPAAAEVERFLTDAIKKYGRRVNYGDKR
jgi:hypothetical protein